LLDNGTFVPKTPVFGAEKPHDLLPSLRCPSHQEPSKSLAPTPIHPPLPSVIRFAVFAVGRVVFNGAYLYRSRIERDGYTIDDVVGQIISAMSAASALVGNLPMQAVENPTPRADRLGNTIHDREVFECMSRHPRPELYSVIPKGVPYQSRKAEGRP
jgi:hypothetical protein